VGKKIIRRRLNPKALVQLAYFFPYRKAPNIKTATADVVPPSICKKVATGEGTSTPTTEIKMPATIEMIKGFLESLLATCFSPSIFADSPSLYNSRTVMETAIAAMPMVAAAKVARCSICSEGKAKVTNGMPKKARLPKTVLNMSRYNVFLENLKRK